MLKRFTICGRWKPQNDAQVPEIIIETDVTLWDEILNPFDALASVSKAWLHINGNCPKFLAYHRPLPALESVIEQLETHDVELKECDCIEWVRNKSLP